MHLRATGVDGGGRETVEAIGTRSGRVVSREPLGADEVASVVSRSPCVHAILITTGTRSSLGSGQGGSESRVDIHVVSLDSAGNVRSLLRDSADTWNQEYKIAGDSSTHYTSLYVAAVRPRADGAFGFFWDEEGGDDNKVPPRLYKWDSRTHRYVQMSGIPAPP